MATVFKPTVTKPMPEGAELFTRKGQQFARWKDAKGRTRTAAVTIPSKGPNAGKPRIVIDAGTYLAKYRDGAGIVRTASTGCHDETAAKAVLQDLVNRAERVRAKVLTTAEDAISNHQDTPLADHIAAYLAHLEAKGTTAAHRYNVGLCFDRLTREIEWTRLAELTRDALEGWLVKRSGEGMSARTRNVHHAVIAAFARWCIHSKRLAVDPFAGVAKADEKAGRRRQRRALTEAELAKLLTAARQRPIMDAMLIRRGTRKGQFGAKLPEATRQRLDRIGWERALIYKTLVLTGLRKGELKSLTVGQLHLAGGNAFAVLRAADEKNREGSEIPIRADLAADLREWLAAKLAALQDAARRRVGATIPMQLPKATRLFDVPGELIRILDRDLVAAGLAKLRDDKTVDKADERGRTIDVHALRHTFGTLLSKGGVAPRTAQAAMRHSKIDLTMNTYTDPKLLDVSGAMDALPELPIPDRADPRIEPAAANGTTGDAGLLQTSERFVPLFVPTHGHSSTKGAIAGKGDRKPSKGSPLVSGGGDKGSAQSDNPCHTAGDATRTRNIQLGRLVLCH